MEWNVALVGTTLLIVAAAAWIVFRS